MKQSSTDSVDYENEMDQDNDDDEEVIDSPKTLFKRTLGDKTNSVSDSKIDEVVLCEGMDNMGMNIFCEYIEIGSIHEINLSSSVKKDLHKIFKAQMYYKDKEMAKEFSIAGRCIADKFTVFDVAATQIEHMLRKDTFARFKRTKEFKDFVKTWHK